MGQRDTQCIHCLNKESRYDVSRERYAVFVGDLPHSCGNPVEAGGRCTMQWVVKDSLVAQAQYVSGQAPVYQIEKEV